VATTISASVLPTTTTATTEDCGGARRNFGRSNFPLAKPETPN
jgi:hypothetical protein